MLIPILILDYELRKDFIIETYCINKKRPELQCDGKCYLSQKIQTEKEKEAKQNFLEKVFGSELPQTNITHYFSIPLVGYECIHIPNYFYLLANYSSPKYRFFHPPIA